MKLDIYDHDDYRAFLSSRMTAAPKRGRGLRGQLAQFIGCQPTFVSHVFAGRYDFSLEQAEATCRFFDLSDDESRYFLLLVSATRAGTASLKAFYENEIKVARNSALAVKKVIGDREELSDEDRARYYQSWHYAAIHMLLTIPHFETIDQISAAMKLPKNLVTDVIKFLTSIGLIRREGISYEVVTDLVHLDNTKPQIYQHHANLRHKAVDHLAAQTSEDLFFSTFLTISKADIPQVKQKLLNAIQGSAELIQNSPSESLCGLNIDFFCLT